MNQYEKHGKPKIQKIYKSLEHEINNFLPQARNLFVEFIKKHDVGGERFPNFCMNTVRWSIRDSDIIFFINNDDGSLRSFIIIGVVPGWNFEYKIELIAGNEEDYSRLIKKAKSFVETQSGLFLTTLCYPSQQLYDIYEECGFTRLYDIKRKKDGSTKFAKYQIGIFIDHQEFYIDEICNIENIILDS